MKIRDPELELQKRREIIAKIFEQSKKGNKEENEKIRKYNEENYASIRGLYEEAKDLSELCKISSLGLGLLRFANKDQLQRFGETTGMSINKLRQYIFLAIFNNSRAKALVNLLQPNNVRAYNKENIKSLQFEKDEVMKGFDQESVLHKEGNNEIAVKTIFWVNKLTKLTQLLEIEKLKIRPTSNFANDNYFSAKKRCEILDLLDDLCYEDRKLLRNEIAEGYKEAFNVDIDDDIERLAEIKNAKSSLYSIKNALMTDLLINYFESTKRDEPLKGIQAMGIKLNEDAYKDSVNAYIAIIRLKGYTSNVYLHIPQFCLEEALVRTGRTDFSNYIPPTIYSTYNPEKLIPVNVLCRVEKGSRRFNEIKKEAEAKKDNIALQQALQQIKGRDIPQYTKALNWERKTVEIDKE